LSSSSTPPTGIKKDVHVSSIPTRSAYYITIYFLSTYNQAKVG